MVLYERYWRWNAYHFDGGPRFLFNKSKVQRNDPAVHALQVCDLPLAPSKGKHLILRVRQESHALLATTRFDGRGSGVWPELELKSSIRLCCFPYQERLTPGGHANERYSGFKEKVVSTVSTGAHIQIVADSALDVIEKLGPP
jgi:hypothetical protein